MMDDPDFAYNYVRPAAVLAGIFLGAWLINVFLDWRQSEREKRETKARNVTPK